MTQSLFCVRRLRRSLIDYNNCLFSGAAGGGDELPLDILTTHGQSASFSGERKDDNGDGHAAAGQDNQAVVNVNVGRTVIARKGTGKKTHKLCSSLLVGGRHTTCPAEKKAAPSQTTKTKAQHGDVKPTRSSIFVLLGLTH